MSPDDKAATDDIPTPPIHTTGPLDERDGHSPFPIVGIGASAGGLEAFKQLLAHLPSDTGMTFVFVQHLDPRHESGLTDLLGRTTSMTVVEATEGLPVRPDHVYIISPNTNLAIHQGILRLTPRPPGRGLHLPVDYLFRSLAEEQKTRAIGVVLSGTGADGTQGLCEIKAVGGITFAQDKNSARHDGMPSSAADNGCADFVLPPEEIAARLAVIGKHPYLTPAAAVLEHGDNNEAQYGKILASVRSVTGVDFSQYRDTTIKRRIMRRMAMHAEQSLEKYIERLAADRKEVEALYHDLLINVTSFFRDAELFDALKEQVFPEIVADKPAMAPLRVWVPGCSTGQEAYSIAMALVEFLDDKPIRPPILIFATDLSDPTSLEKARAGLYPESIEAEVTPERLRRFFRKEDHVYGIEKSIRDVCVFARQDINRDPPFSHVDLISCRNVLIYLATPLQRRVLPTFHYALNVPGFLVLGTAETVGENTDLFDLVDRDNRIYVKKANASRPHVQFGPVNYKTAGGLEVHRGGQRRAIPAEFQREADRILLGRYAPPGVLVNDNLEIIQFRGRTSAYLEPPPGEPTANLLKMAREGLFIELRSALAEAARQNQPVRREGARVRTNGGVREISLEVVPVKPSNTNEACFLVLFHEDESPDIAQKGQGSTAKDQPDIPPFTPGSSAGREVAQLQNELTATKEYLQSLVEQQDATNEELRSANEEILSSNEELQSTNEELETAKEELQSSNEELSTVNEQLQSRNLELSQTTNDLTNLLTSTAIPVVMVGNDLRIRSFTAAARRAMSLLPTDVGRPINDLKASVDVPDLDAIIQDVIESVQVKSREVLDREGRWHMLRIHPYRTADNKIDGAVVMLLDIDEIKATEKRILQQAELLDLAYEPIFARDKGGRIIYWNRGASELYGYTAEEVLGRVSHEILQPGMHLPQEISDAALERDGHWFGEVVHLTRDGRQLVVESRQQVVTRSDGQRIVLETNRDISERKQFEDELKQRVEELRESDRRKNDFIAVLSHELRNPLAPIYNALAVLRSPDASESQARWSREVIDRQVNQMARLLDDLLDISRITGGKLQLRKGPVELAKVIESAIETSQPEIEAADHKLMIDLPADPMWLDADPTRLAEVFSNLLTNAAKYTDRGGQVWLTAGRQGNEAIVTVKDSGIGIAKDLLPHIFDMFVQGERGLQRIYGGLGLGLTLARELVQMHGGSIEAKSEGLGKGSEFIVRLPLGEAREPVDNSRAEFRLTARAKLPEVKRVLVVDDSAIHAQSLGMFLEMAGYEVRTARDGLSALEVLTEFLPDVALIDIGLPGLNGYDLARAIHDQPQLRNTVLVAQTGWGREEDRRSAQAAGFDYHLTKPIDPEDVLKLLAGLARD
jgi:two-component system CheB/CheR fusion protein